MQPSSTPPPRRSSRARQPRATFIAWTKSPRPLRLRSLRRKERQVGPVVGPPADRVCGPSLRRGAHGPRLLGLRMDRDDLAGLQVFDLRHEALRADALRAPHVFRLEAPRLAARQVPQDDERPDRRHLGEGVLVARHVADMERAQADEGRHAIHLAALLLAEQLRRRGHAPAERLRELAGERLAESVRAQVEIEAAVDLLDPRDEGPRISGPVHAGDHERSHAAHFPRREFAAVATHLQGAFEVSAPLLLARIAERGLDPHADSEVLDGLQVLEPSERLDCQREVVRVLLAGDVRERDAFPRGHLRDRLAKESREREFAVDLGPARFQAEGAAGRAAFDVEDLRRRDDRMLLQEIPGAEALIRRPFRSALDAKHLGRFRTARRYLRTGVADIGPDTGGEGHKYPSARRFSSMAKAKPRSWWRMRQIRHRDAVALAVLSSAFLLAGELVNQDIPSVYEKYILQSGALNNLGFLILIVALIILGFTTYFGGVFVLLGGLHFSWGRVGRGRFLVGLGIGVSLIGLVSRLAQALLVTGTPLTAIIPYTTSLTGLGILFGIVSHTLMGQYALLLKKHAKRVWRRWRKAQPESDEPSRTPAAKSSRRTARGARR